jgi:hypothetical protein
MCRRPDAAVQLIQHLPATAHNTELDVRLTAKAQRRFVPDEPFHLASCHVPGYNGVSRAVPCACTATQQRIGWTTSTTIDGTVILFFDLATLFLIGGLFFFVVAAGTVAVAV